MEDLQEYQPDKVRRYINYHLPRIEVAVLRMISLAEDKHQAQLSSKEREVIAKRSISDYFYAIDKTPD